jgi:hypothetical protein
VKKERRFHQRNTLTPNGEHRCNTWQGEFPAAMTPPRTVTGAPARWTPSRPTASAFTASPETCGGGAPTGSARPTSGMPASPNEGILPARRPERPGARPGRLVPLPQVVLQPLAGRRTLLEHPELLPPPTQGFVATLTVGAVRRGGFETPSGYPTAPAAQAGIPVYAFFSRARSRARSMYFLAASGLL